MADQEMNVGVTRSMVFDGPGQPMRLETVGTPVPAAGQVLVRVTCCTVCGSDLHTFQGHRGTPLPTILGHEMVGVVEAVGGVVRDVEGTAIAVGDRLTWSVAASCGTCFFCTHGLPQKCERLFKYGHERLRVDQPLSGGLAEQCLLEAGTAIVKLPAEIPDAVAAPLNCATATVAAAMRVGTVVAGEIVLVQGLGALGVTAAAMASALGAAAVIAVDLSEERLKLAKRFGATHAATAGNAAELTELVRSVSAGRGVDVALELSGAAASIEQGLPLLRTGGRYVWVGSVSKSRDVAINPETIVRRMLRLEGVHNYTPTDLIAAVKFMGANHARFPFAELVESRWPLERAEEAFRHAIAVRAPRVAVVA